MAQPFYTPDEEVTFDSQSKRDTLSISHTVPEDPQHEMLERGSGCIGPGVEIDTKGRNSTRRRIPVAVNSSMLQTKVSGWPYPVNAPVPQSQRLGLYTSSMNPKLGALSGNPPNPRASSFSRAPEYDMGTVDPQTHYAHQSLGLDHPISYEDEASASYNTHSSAYVLPSSPQGVIPDFCAFGWNPKGWTPGLQNGRSSIETMFAGHDSESPSSHSVYPYMFCGQGSQSAEISPVVPTQGSLASPGQGGERALPNLAGRNSVQINAAAVTAPSDAISRLQLAHDYRAGPRWIQKSDPPTFMHPSSHASSGAGAGNRTKVLSSNTQEMVLGYLPITSTGPSSPLLPPSGKFTGLEAPVDSSDDENTDRRLARTFSRDNSQWLSLAEYSSENYGYSSREKKNKNRNDASGGILSNGMQYTRPPPPVSTLPDVFSDFRTPEIHRPPVSGLSNPGGF